MNDLVKLLAGSKGTVSTRGALFVLLIYIAWAVTSQGEQLQKMSERMAVVEYRLGVQRAALQTNNYASHP